MPLTTWQTFAGIRVTTTSSTKRKLSPKLNIPQTGVSHKKGVNIYHHYLQQIAGEKKLVQLAPKSHPQYQLIQDDPEYTHTTNHERNEPNIRNIINPNS